jgi:hypothetical protein
VLASWELIFGSPAPGTTPPPQPALGSSKVQGSSHGLGSGGGARVPFVGSPPNKAPCGSVCVLGVGVDGNDRILNPWI